MSYRFEKLKVWQDARAFAKEIYTLTKSFPRDERFGLTDQMRRASVSILLTITEGSDRKSDKEFIRYLRMAITSAEEVAACLYVAFDQGYISDRQFHQLYDQSNQLVARLNALVRSLSRKQSL